MDKFYWYTIYKTTHVETDEFYVGRHKTDNLDDNYQGSGNWVEQMEDKSYLITEILEYCADELEMVATEQAYIDMLFDHPLCRNESRYSTGWLVPPPPTPERNAKISKAKMGQRVPEEVKEKIRQTLLGRKLSTEHCKNIRNSLLGRTFTDEWLQKISEARAETWIVTYIDSGEEIEITNLTHWAEENGYSQSNLSLVARGERRQHKGITIRKKGEEPKYSLEELRVNPWIVTVIATGEEIVVENIMPWAKEHGYNGGCLCLVAKGKRKQHKGLLCRRAA